MEMPLRGEVVLNGEDSSLLQALQEEDDFTIRRAVERLREGLFDPVAVRLLTAHEEWLRDESERGFRAVDAGKFPHLCIVVCGTFWDRNREGCESLHGGDSKSMPLG